MYIICVHIHVAFLHVNIVSFVLMLDARKAVRWNRREFPTSLRLIGRSEFVQQTHRATRFKRGAVILGWWLRRNAYSIGQGKLSAETRVWTITSGSKTGGSCKLPLDLMKCPFAAQILDVETCSSKRHPKGQKLIDWLLYVLIWHPGGCSTQPNGLINKSVQRVETTNRACFDHGISQTTRVDGCRSGPLLGKRVKGHI